MTYISGKWRQRLHLEPPRGWMNDPNGLCYFKGKYHVYFQYSPADANGGELKCWGHYESSDMLKWTFTGTVLSPDTPDDKDGVYSGSAVVNGDRLDIFYTGNVKLVGNYDYITAGRGANVIHVTTDDGHHMSTKKVVLRNEDYPQFCSNHVRDPKVWREDGKWHMVLGARTLEDRGCVLFYVSDDLDKWQYESCDFVDDFGYMWECPDYFRMNGFEYLSVSPQGVESEKYRYQNLFQSGYFQEDSSVLEFTEWDFGFDFYAPQTFDLPDGRRILIGWMGIGDTSYFNPTTELGYQHCLTIPRELICNEDGKILQRPIRELAALRGESLSVKSGQSISVSLPFELKADVGKSFRIEIDGGLRLEYNGSEFAMSFSEYGSGIGCGRQTRRTLCEFCGDISIIADMSSVEVFLDGGKKVLSTRFYPDDEAVSLSLRGIDADVYKLRGMEAEYIGK